MASGQGHVNVASMLLKDSRVHPGDCGNAAIQLASLRGHLQIVQILLEDSRVNPGDDNNFAIRYASRNGHLQIVDRLLEDSRIDFDVALKIACENGYYHYYVNSYPRNKK